MTAEFPFYTKQFPAYGAPGGWSSGGWAHGQCDYVLAWRRMRSKMATLPDFVWFWEYDAQLRGGTMAQFLAAHNDMKHDLLASRYLHPYIHEPEWYWWSAAPRKHLPVPEDEQWSAAFPVARFSRRFMDTLEREIHQWNTFMEIAFPTLAIYHFGAESASNLRPQMTEHDAFRTIQPGLSQDEIYRAEQRGVLTLIHPVKG